MINNVFFVIDPIVPNCISLIIYKFDHKSENFTEILRDGKKWYLSIVVNLLSICLFWLIPETDESILSGFPVADDKRSDLGYFF